MRCVCYSALPIIAVIRPHAVAFIMLRHLLHAIKLCSLLLEAHKGSKAVLLYQHSWSSRRRQILGKKVNRRILEGPKELVESQ